MISLISKEHNYQKTLTPRTSSTTITKTGNKVKRFLNQDYSLRPSVAFIKAVENAEHNINDILDISSLKQDVAHADAQKLISGGGYIEISPESPETSAKFTVNVPNSGDYDVTFRYGNATGATQYLDVFVNDVKVNRYDFLSRKDWDTQEDKTISLSLNAGDNTITLNAIPSGSQLTLDYISVNPRDGSVPEIRYEAENSKLTNDAVVHLKEDLPPGIESIENELIAANTPDHSVELDDLPATRPPGRDDLKYNSTNNLLLKKELFQDEQLKKFFSILSLKEQFSNKAPVEPGGGSFDRTVSNASLKEITRARANTAGEYNQTREDSSSKQNSYFQPFASYMSLTQPNNQVGQSFDYLV